MRSQERGGWWSASVLCRGGGKAARHDVPEQGIFPPFVWSLPPPGVYSSDRMMAPVQEICQSFGVLLTFFFFLVTRIEMRSGLLCTSLSAPMGDRTLYDSRS